MSVSIIVCCYNSAARLPETMKHLAQQQVNANQQWEVIVVDNASTDDTKEVAEREWQSAGAPTSMQVLRENKLGLRYAREKGILAAQYDYIIFCDDDNWLAPDYVQQAEAIMCGDNEIGMAGGVGTPVFETNEAPAWFSTYQGVFACGPQVDYEGYARYRDVGMYGAGMVARRDILQKLVTSGYEFLLTDRKGKSLSSGHDWEMVIILRLLGYKAYFSSKLKFGHYMTAARMNRKYLKKLAYGLYSNAALIGIYADMYQLSQSGNSRYRTSWVKDIARSFYGFLNRLAKHPSEIGVNWQFLSAATYSILSNINNYKKWQQHIENGIKQMNTLRNG